MERLWNYSDSGDGLLVDSEKEYKELHSGEEAQVQSGDGRGGGSGRTKRRRPVKWGSPEGRRNNLLLGMDKESQGVAYQFGGRSGLHQELMKRVRLFNQNACDPAVGDPDPSRLISEDSVGDSASVLRKWDKLRHQKPHEPPPEQQQQQEQLRVQPADSGRTTQGRAGTGPAGPRRARGTVGRVAAAAAANAGEGTLPQVGAVPSSGMSGQVAVDGINYQKRYRQLWAFKNGPVNTLINKFTAQFPGGNIAVSLVSPHGSGNVKLGAHGPLFQHDVIQDKLTTAVTRIVVVRWGCGRRVDVRSWARCYSHCGCCLLTSYHATRLPALQEGKEMQARGELPLQHQATSDAAPAPACKGNAGGSGYIVFQTELAVEHRAYLKRVQDGEEECMMKDGMEVRQLPQYASVLWHELSEERKAVYAAAAAEKGAQSKRAASTAAATSAAAAAVPAAAVAAAAGNVAATSLTVGGGVPLLRAVASAAGGAFGASPAVASSAAGSAVAVGNEPGFAASVWATAAGAGGTAAAAHATHTGLLTAQLAAVECEVVCCPRAYLCVRVCRYRASGLFHPDADPPAVSRAAARRGQHDAASSQQPARHRR